VTPRCWRPRSPPDPRSKAHRLPFTLAPWLEAIAHAQPVAKLERKLAVCTSELEKTRGGCGKLSYGCRRHASERRQPLAPTAPSPSGPGSTLPRPDHQLRPNDRVATDLFPFTRARRFHSPAVPGESRSATGSAGRRPRQAAVRSAGVGVRNCRPLAETRRVSNYSETGELRSARSTDLSSLRWSGFAFRGGKSDRDCDR
jgi:hypothetical protein